MMHRSVLRLSGASLGLAGALAIVLAAAPGSAQTGSAQTGSSQAAAAPMPSFTSAQVTLGARVYTQSCQGCHGDKLQGGRSPALIGEKFLAKWADGKRPVADLHGYIAKNMPRNKPGTLTTAQALNVTAFVLSKNGYKAGKRSLTATALKVPLSAPATQTP
ncbi:c-type cytochrome [Deinococcus deserti]|uniref:Putative cytochrome c n=1 Tax=Deinococcus deserti (strain DSM 17065 / CIP 109153 / LMG 22923 / VCD115) TaxID=546414 RepID=C1CWL4_DEIDV|nr:c-type cytochrome [Deinococcus deserti]ACO46581.1 putative cytochrome c, precursor [Deinococcus deserti VCD115]